MDYVTRPNTQRTQQRLSGSRSLSAPTVHASNSETEEEGLPSSTKSNGEESETIDDHGEDEDEDPATKELDLRASRRTERKRAQKFSNYSTKHQPQDGGIPGYQHKAKEASRTLLRHTTQPEASQQSKKRKSEANDHDTGYEKPEEEHEEEASSYRATTSAP